MYTGTGQEYPPILKTASGTDMILQEISVHAALEDILLLVTITQTYKNTGNKPKTKKSDLETGAYVLQGRQEPHLQPTGIEAVYTFPLPSHAVLLEVEMAVGNKRYAFGVMEKGASAQLYDCAKKEGDQGVLLEEEEPGLYTLKIGNILFGETIQIRMKYGQLLFYRDKTLRIRFPFTLPPRFGDQENERVPYDVEIREAQKSPPWIRFEMRIKGISPPPLVSSPTHPLKLFREEEGLVIRLDEKTFVPDKDLLLDIEKKEHVSSGVLRGKDIRGSVVLATFQPCISIDKSASKTIIFMVDCSGSMQGVPIADAGKAISEALEVLSEKDRFTIFCFGSHGKFMFEQPMPATEKNIQLAKELLRETDADMGGTRMEEAFTTLYSSLGKDICADIMLFTDGCIWRWQEMAEMVSGYPFVRIFSIGVGPAISEPFFAALSRAGNGAWEWVAPMEKPLFPLIRQMRRIRCPKVLVSVSASDAHATPLPLENRAVFDGDTVHAFVHFPKEPNGSIYLHLQEKGNIRTLEKQLEKEEKKEDPVHEPDALARIAAARKISLLEDRFEIASLAMEYRLLSSYTAFIGIRVRKNTQKANIPVVLKKIPHLLPFGWEKETKMQNQKIRSEPPMGFSHLDSPDMHLKTERDILLFIRNFNLRFAKGADFAVHAARISDLEALGLPKSVSVGLYAILKKDVEEWVLVMDFLYYLLNSKWKKEFSPFLKKKIIRARENLPDAEQAIIPMIAEIFHSPMEMNTFSKVHTLPD